MAGSGPYNEQLIINGKIPNASATNTITFNGNGNTITFGSTNTLERATIKLNNANYFIFDSLNIKATGSTYGFGVHLTNNADSNTFQKCNITSSITSTSNGFAGVVISASSDATTLGNSLCDANLFVNNSITGGYYGISQTATFSTGVNNYNQFINNNILDYYYAGVFVNGSNNTLFKNNKITRPTLKTNTLIKGIFFSGPSTNVVVSHNRIFSPFKTAPTSTATFFGIQFDAVLSSPGNENFIVNNLIYDIVSNGLIYGIYNAGNSDIGIFHNTISLDDTTSTSPSSTYGYYQSASNNNTFFINNLITISRGGGGSKYCFYGASVPTEFDYNNYYISSKLGNNYIGYYTKSLPTIKDWKAALQQINAETNSFSITPYYQQPLPANANSNYAPMAAYLNDKGYDVDVLDDIVGNIRNITKPDIGAYEFSPNPCLSSKLNGITSIKVNNKVITIDTATCQNILIDLDVNITGAYGSSQTFQWERVVDTTQAAQAFLPLLTHPDTSFLMGATTYFYRCKISCSEVNFYTNWRKIISSAAMYAGTYTINSLSPTN